MSAALSSGSMLMNLARAKLLYQKRHEVIIQCIG